MLTEVARNAALLAFVFGVSTGSAAACGEPDDLVLAQTFLSIKFENATHVTGAVWQAQKSGVLPMPNPEKFSADPQRAIELVDQAHIAALKSQGLMGLNLASLATEKWAISLVLVETMHWGRFELDPFRAFVDNSFDCNASSSAPGDLIVVTQALVLHSIANGLLTVSQALDLEVMRLYGSEERRDAFVEQFETLGKAPLEDVSGIDGFLARITNMNELMPPKASATDQ